ncbi:MAG: glycerophosphodiester phosphodiesterase family protein [Bacillota bacterium]|jgi:glycerophosphoryl diester phosphodiesterase
MMRSSRWSNPGFVVAAVLAAALVIVIAVFSLRRFNFCSPREVQWLKDTPIAHRGLHDDTRDENSLSAFAHAVYRGYAIELDVRLTKDEVPVVFHDDNLSRLCGVDKSVSEMELDELKGHKLPKSGETIPTLAEALDLVNGQVPLLIEVKDFGIPGALEQRILEVIEGYDGDYAIQSFNPLVCRYFRKHDDRLVVGLLLTDIPGLRFRGFRNLKDNLFSAICSPGFVAYNYREVTDEVTRALRAASVTLLGYGLYEEDISSGEYKRYVDNIIFELDSNKP